MTLCSLRAQKILFSLTLIVSQLFLAACSSGSSRANAQETKPAAVAPSSEKPAEPVVESHTIKRGETPLTLARAYLSRSSLMTVAELDAAIRDANHLGKS